MVTRGRPAPDVGKWDSQLLSTRAVGWTQFPFLFSPPPQPKRTRGKEVRRKSRNARLEKRKQERAVSPLSLGRAPLPSERPGGCRPKACGDGEEAGCGQAAGAGRTENVIFHATPSKVVLETKKRKKEDKAMHLDWNLGPGVPVDWGKGAHYSKPPFPKAAPAPKRLNDHNQPFLPYKRGSLDSSVLSNSFRVILGQFLQGREYSANWLFHFLPFLHI